MSLNPGSVLSSASSSVAAVNPNSVLNGPGASVSAVNPESIFVTGVTIGGLTNALASDFNGFYKKVGTYNGQPIYEKEIAGTTDTLRAMYEQYSSLPAYQWKIGFADSGGIYQSLFVGGNNNTHFSTTLNNFTYVYGGTEPLAGALEIESNDPVIPESVLPNNFTATPPVHPGSIF